MNYTSSEASKLLKKLNEEHDALIEQERQRKDFLAALGEDIESVRPQYDYNETQTQLEELEVKILKVKHIINMFNVTHVVPGFDLTIDQMLVFIPQLTARKQKLFEMKKRLPKARESASPYGRAAAVIDYRYTNYDPETVAKDFETVSDTLSKAQVALDLINNRDTMEIDI